MNTPYTTTTTTEPVSTRPENPMDRQLLVVPVIITINVLVFSAWMIGTKNPSILNVMNDNFVVSTKLLLEGRLWTVLTAAFSHQALWHIALNMFVLWSFGSLLERLWGVWVFLSFYLSTAVFSSLCHCAVSSALIGNPSIEALGASGAISGLLLAFAFMFPKHKILLFGVIPIPALVGAMAFVAVDLWGLFAQTQGGGIGIGHGAHLGGALCGFLFWAMYLRTRFQPHQQGDNAQMPMTPEEIQEFQRLRQKLDVEGPGALNPKEKLFLEQIRERVMRAHEGR